ncbi:MAG: ADOP family duplicated permease [Terriglobia bacterium]
MRSYQRFLRKARTERQLDAELRFHLEQQIADYVAAGIAPDEARRRARLEFGGLDQVKEECRDVGAARFIETLIQDVRYGLRQLRRNPGFTAVAVITLALGIGANTAIFSVVYGVLLRPLPYPDSDRIAMVYARFSPQDVEHGTMSIADYLDLRAQDHAFQDLALFSNSSRRFDISGSGSLPEQVSGMVVTSGFFDILGEHPLLGRVLRSGEDSPTSTPVAIRSESLWRRRFRAQPDVIGQALKVGNREYTIIGVMPATFRFWPNTEIWMNLQIKPPARRGPFPFIAMGRLKSGVSFRLAQAETNTNGHSIEEEYPKTYSHMSFPVVPLKQAVVGNVRRALLLMFGAVVFVLLIAAVNVANLHFARSSARGREMSLRTALGADRRRIVRQLLTESMLLSLLGGIAGLVMAYKGIALLRTWNPGNLPRIEDVRLDPAVLIFTGVISLLSGILFGLAPALQSSRIDLNASLKQGVRGFTGNILRQRTQAAFVISEIALSLMLLIGAGLLLRSFTLLYETSPGFEGPPQNILTMQVSLSNWNYSAPSFRPALARYSRLLDHIGHIPGVRWVALSTSRPPDRRWDWDTFQIKGQPWTQEEYPAATCPQVTPHYFRTLGIPLIRGRYFDERDTPDSPPVVIISETLARRYFGNQDPIGKELKQSGPDLHNRWMKIVGVVRDVKYQGLNGEPKPVYYEPYSQAFGTVTMRLMVRTSVPAQSMGATVRRSIQHFDSTIAVQRVKTMKQVLSESVSEPRFRTVLLAIFAGVALVLAAIGIYGVISYSVAQRTHEIGIRMALGAKRSDVVRVVLGQGMTLAAIGLGIGITAALGVSRFLASQLYGISPTDLFTFVAVSLVLSGVALLACYIPARRAAKVDPAVALRHE